MADTTSNPQEILSALNDMATGFMKSQALYLAAKLGIADHLSAGPQSSDALAEAVGAHPGALYRLLRFLEYLGLFYEPEPGKFALTAMGEYLRSDAPGGIRNEAIFNMELVWPGWGELAYTVTTGRSADQRAFGASFFEHLQQHPHLVALFNDSMTRFIATMAPAVAAAYGFRPFRTIVDVGGGHGTLMAAILQANPQARGVIFDLPITVEGAQKYMVELGLSERCACLGGDFFKEVPPGDAIILSAVISDWDDEKSVHILANCRRAVAPEGRLLLIERRLIPEEPAPATAFLDLQMLLLGGGAGRTAGEYRRLLAEAGFELARIISTGTQRSIFEARPV